MRNSTSIDDLHPIVAEKARRFIYVAEGAGIGILIASTLRDAEAQADIYALARTTPGPHQNTKRPMGFTVTQNAPGASFHEYGCAFDAHPTINGRLVKSISPCDWRVWLHLAEIAKMPRVNLQWGGRHRPKDGLRELWHFHYSAGLTAQELAAGSRLPDVSIGTIIAPTNEIKSGARKPAAPRKRAARGK